MNQRKRFFLDGIRLSAVGIGVRIVAVIFAAYLTRAVGAEGMGLYSMITTVYSFALTFATAGISLTVTRLTAAALGEGDENEAAKLLRSAFIYALGFASAAMLVLLFGSRFIAVVILRAPSLSRPLAWLSFSLIPAALSAVIGGYFVGVRRVGKNALTQIVGQILRVASAVLFLALLSGGGVEGAIVALALSSLLTESLTGGLLLLLLFLDRRAFGAKKAGKKELAVGRVAKNTLPLAFSQYVRQALLTLEHVLIPRLLLKRGESSETAYSHYGELHGMAMPTVLFALAPLSSFAGLLVAEFAECEKINRREKMSRIATEAINLALTYSVAVSMLLYLFSEELGFVIYGSYDVGRHIATVAPIIPIMYLDHLTDAMLKGIGEQVYSMWVNVSDSLLSIFLVIVLIPSFGISGYAAVIIIMEAYNFTLSALRFRRRVAFRINFVSSLILPALAAFLAMKLSELLFISPGSSSTAFLLAMKMSFAICAFVAAISLLRLIPKRKGSTKINRNNSLSAKPDN